MKATPGKAEAAKSMMGAGVCGFLLAILGIVGASLIFKYKWASVVFLSLTALGLILVGSITIHGDMAVYGALFFLPVIFAAVSKRGGKEK